MHVCFVRLQSIDEDVDHYGLPHTDFHTINEWNSVLPSAPITSSYIFYLQSFGLFSLNNHHDNFLSNIILHWHQLCSDHNASSCSTTKPLVPPPLHFTAPLRCSTSHLVWIIIFWCRQRLGKKYLIRLFTHYINTTQWRNSMTQQHLQLQRQTLWLGQRHRHLAPPLLMTAAYFKLSECRWSLSHTLPTIQQLPACNNFVVVFSVTLLILLFI